MRRCPKVLLRADNWHDPMVIEACEKLLRQYRCDYEVEIIDRGPERRLDGHDEIEIFLGLTKELALDMDRWVHVQGRVLRQGALGLRRSGARGIQDGEAVRPAKVSGGVAENQAAEPVGA